MKRLASSGDRSEHDKDIERKREKRSRAAEVYIPEPYSIKRREKCLADPERLLRTYFKPIFYNPFAKHHKAMINAIWERALSGGDKALAAPRGDGKSQITICMTIAVMLGTSIVFPVVIGNTLSKGKKLFKQIQAKFNNKRKYPEFYDDFPEITACVSGLDGAPQRAAKQHVRGVKTDIRWSQNELVLPYVDSGQFKGISWGGKRLTYFGLDSAIRGEGFEELRPDLAIIDDPETRDVAFSPTGKHRDIEDMVNGDVAGLSGPDKKMARVLLTTIQNRRCYSWRVTCRKTTPTFEGDRYPLLAKWPNRTDLWDEYIALRQQDQAEGKKDGPTALKFYLDNQEEMQKGSELTNPHRFVADTNSDGEPVEVDALQAFYNRIADWGLPRVLAELQQEPEEEETEQTLGLTAGSVQKSLSGLGYNVLPKADCIITLGCDVGKYYSHWIKIAWHDNAIGNIFDYGVMETPGMLTKTNPESVMEALLAALLAWRPQMLTENPPDFALVDSGDYTKAVYEFVRRAKGIPFAASKGHPGGKLRMDGSDSNTRRHFDHCRADFQEREGLWLYNVNADHWKNQVHEYFTTSPFNEANQPNPGSLSLYVSDDPREHLSFAHHIVAEELQTLFVEGKGLQTKWVCKNKNNHWLDATALACCAAGVMGVKVLPATTPMTPMTPAAQPHDSRFKLTTPDGRPFLVTERT